MAVLQQSRRQVYLNQPAVRNSIYSVGYELMLLEIVQVERVLEYFGTLLNVAETNRHFRYPCLWCTGYPVSLTRGRFQARSMAGTVLLLCCFVLFVFFVLLCSFALGFGFDEAM